MIPLKTIEDLISKHQLLEKELSSGSIDKKKFAEKSKEYSDLNEVIIDAKKFISYESNKLELQKILDDNNPENFKGIRDVLFTFQQKNDIVSKLSRLQELYKELQEIVISNNQKLSKHTEVSQLVATINNQQNIGAADNIPIIINDIKEKCI